MSEEPFTNRHGHSFSDVQVAADMLPEPEHKTAAPKPVRRKRSKFQLSRLQVRVIVIFVVLAIAIPLAAGEYIRASYLGEVTNAKRDIAAIFTDTVKKQSNGLTSAELKGYDGQISTLRDKLCGGGFQDNLAQLYPRSKQAYDDCNTYRSKVSSLEASVAEAGAQMAYFEQLQVLLGGVTKPLTDQFAVLSSQQDNWQAFVSGLGQLSVPVSLSSVHAELVTDASAIHDQWIALVQASNAFDSAKFTDARTKIADSYTTFRAVASKFTDATSVSQTTLSKEVAAVL